MAASPAITIAETIDGVACRRQHRTSSLRGLRITFPGGLALLAMGMVAAGSVTSEANLLLLLCGICLGVLLFNAVACARMLRKLHIERGITELTVAGRPFRVVYTVRNHRRWLGCWAVRVGEVPLSRQAGQGRDPDLPYAFIPYLGPQAETRVETRPTIFVRGRHALPGVRVSSGFPFGLFRCSVDLRCRADLMIYPALGRMRREMWRQHAILESPTPRTAEERTGQDEFHGVREYRAGDNPRRIHWKRSARTGQLIVREHMPNRDSQLIVLLDPWPLSPDGPPVRRLFGERGLLSDPAQEALIERVISAAATICCDALDRGHRVGLVCRAAVPTMIPPAGGRGQRQRLLRELTLLAPGEGPSFDQLIAGVRWSNGWHANCALLTSKVCPAHQRIARVLGSRSESMMVISHHAGTIDKLFENLPPLVEVRRPS